jgi:hypothetical protein
MRSARGVASAVFMLLALPATILSSQISDDAPGVVIHIMLGVSCVALALAIADFGLPRWLNWVGIASAAGVGAIFLLQAVSSAIPNNEPLDGFAFGILGQTPERLLPLGVSIWFAGLLLAGTKGRTRLIGWALVPACIGLQVGTFLGLVLGIEVQNLKIVFLLVFAWLLIESLKAGRSSDGSPTRASRLVESSAS